eukprot:3531544-Amphidinium_carterae.1
MAAKSTCRSSQCMQRERFTWVLGCRLRIIDAHVPFKCHAEAADSVSYSTDIIAYWIEDLPEMSLLENQDAIRKWADEEVTYNEADTAEVVDLI